LPPIKAETAGLEVYKVLKRILVAVIFVPILLVVLVGLPPVWTAILVAFISAMASFELLRATKVAHHNGMYVYTALAAVMIPLGSFFGETVFGLSKLIPMSICAFLLMCALFLSSIRHFDTDDPIPLEHIMVCMFGGVVIPAFLSALSYLRMMEQGRYLVLLPIICAFLTDAGAYFAGVFLGKHRGITKVSPNKSLEGYIGGILSGGIFLLIYALILNRFVGLAVSYHTMAVYGLVGSAVTELGDLSFSLIKRQYGVKDYGNLLPGHGGMLDRFDSMIFAAPALWLMVELTPPAFF
jgi:phosphatidate cytidylyltransferase